MVSNYILSEDLMVEILSRLKPRQLLQLRCVCKPWRFLIDSISFIKVHYRRQYSMCKDELLFCLDSGIPHLDVHERYYLFCDKQCDHVQYLSNGLLDDNATLFAEPPHVSSVVDCIGVVYGIICLQWRDKEIGLWNPATRDFTAIEHWLDLHPVAVGVSMRLIGFGFDSVSNDFKIVTGNYSRMPKLEEKYKIYSLNTGTWKSISAPTTVIYTTGSPMNAYLNGICYWPGKTFENLNGGRFRKFNVILAFNFSTEIFEAFPPPHDALVVKEGCRFDWKIEVYMESIAVIANNVDLENGNGSVNIWIVTKSHEDSIVPLAWEHLLTIQETPAYHFIWANRLKSYNHLIFLTTEMKNEEESYCLLYNVSTSTFKRLGITFNYCFNFTESLFPLSKRFLNK